MKIKINNNDFDCMKAEMVKQAPAQESDTFAFSFFWAFTMQELSQFPVSSPKSNG